MDNKIITQLQKLIEKTREGKLPWKSVGQNVVRWTRQDGARLFTITLQKQNLSPIVKATQPNRKDNFIFTIQGTNPNEIVLQVNTSNDTTLLDLLEVLYQSALISTQAGSADIIDKLLGDL